MGKKWRLFVLSIAFVWGTAACAGGTQTPSSAPAQQAAGTQEKNEEGAGAGSGVIKIGAVLPMTGPAAVFGQKFQEAYAMALEEINANGGVKGKKLDVVIEDSQEQPQLGTTATEKLANDPEILVLTGGRSSGVTLAMAKVANDNRIPYLIEHGSSDTATRSGWDYVFRLNPTSGMYTEALRNYLDEVVQPQKVAWLQVDNAFGDAVYEFGLKDYFAPRDFEVLHEKYSADALDLKAVMTKVRHFAPDVVIMTSGTDNEAVQIMKAAKEAGVTPKAFIGTGAGHSIQGFWDQDSSLAQYVMTSGPWHGDKKQEAWQRFAKKFEETYGHAPGEHEVEGYVAIYVLADALERAVSLEREAVKEALAATDLQTIFGRVKFEDFDGYRNQNRPVTELSQWIDGQLVTVYPDELAVREPVYPFPGWD